MKCIAIDDEPVALLILKQYCRRIGDIELKYFSDPVTGMQEVNRINPDLLFLDIRMGEVSGISLAKEIPKGTSLIFTTAYSEYAIDGFDLNAVDFLHKPFSYARFCTAVEKARQLKKLKELSLKPVFVNKEIIVKAGYRNVKIRISDIIYIESIENYIRIHILSSHSVLSQISLKSIRELLPSQFVRIHKSFIVPIYRIASFTGTGVTLYNSDITIPVGRAYHNDFIKTINEQLASDE